MGGSGLASVRDLVVTLTFPVIAPTGGKPAVRNLREGDGNVGIMRSPVRAIVLPDRNLLKTKMAFVGGYWAYKERQFDRYLNPYERRLPVFGYSAWPYANYGGQSADEEEPSLYRQAMLCPYQRAARGVHGHQSQRAGLQGPR